MTIKEFELLNESDQMELALSLVKLDLPGLFVFNKKPINVKNTLGSLKWGQWVTLAGICGETRADNELMRHLLLVFHFTELTGEKFNMDTYADYIGVTDAIDIVYAYPIGRHYLKVVTDMAKEMGENCSMPYSEDDVAAGVQDLEKFGHTGTLIEYAKAFGVKRWGDVLDYGFNEVYVYLWRETVKERINKKRCDNMNKNNK